MRHLVSDLSACLWIPAFPLRCEESRRPDLTLKPTALLAPEDSRRIWYTSSRARREGVRVGMTVSQAIGLCPTLTLIEPDPVHYDERFAHILMQLGDVSPVIEPAELGRVFVGVDGLEGLFGRAERQLETIGRMAEWQSGTGTETTATLPPCHPAGVGRLGWGKGKFVSWVAATRATAAPIVVPVGKEVAFLAGQPLTVLPLDPDNHRRLRQLGLRTLGEFAALPETAVIQQFGREGRAAWRLAAGVVRDPVQGRAVPEPIVAALDFPAPVADQGMLLHTIGLLVEHALNDRRRIGWRVAGVRVRAALEQGMSWMIEALLRDPAALRERIVAPLAAKLEQSPPTGAVERLTVELTAFARGTDELQLFARDAASAARAGRRSALRAAAREMRARLKRQMLYRVIEVQPKSRLPERRYALIAYEP